MSELEEILLELKLIEERDKKTGMSNMDEVLNYLRDINNEEGFEEKANEWIL